MNNKLSLVILAAGIGSRYGGKKQMDAFTPYQETIIDFSLYSALKVGFNKFVFVIRESFEDEFKAHFDAKLKGKAEVEYVYQEINRIPEKYDNPERVKPWGTGHALLMTKDVIQENFAIINADDFYGDETFKLMAESLAEKNPNSCDFNMMAYILKNTISNFGSVSRGECKISAEGFLQNITERTHIEMINGQLMRKDEDEQLIPISGETKVSMNFWGFTPKCFEYVSELFFEFLETSYTSLNAEFYLPTIVNHMLNNRLADVEVLISNAKWFGVTYKEDKPAVEQAIKELKQSKVYPERLWKDD